MVMPLLQRIEAEPGHTLCENVGLILLLEAQAGRLSVNGVLAILEADASDEESQAGHKDSNVLLPLTEETATSLLKFLQPK